MLEDIDAEYDGEGEGTLWNEIRAWLIRHGVNPDQTVPASDGTHMYLEASDLFDAALEAERDAVRVEARQPFVEACVEPGIPVNVQSRLDWLQTFINQMVQHEGFDEPDPDAFHMGITEIQAMHDELKVALHCNTAAPQPKSEAETIDDIDRLEEAQSAGNAGFLAD